MTLEEFAAEYEHLLPFLLLVDSQSDEQVTYFETLTALAYLWFADRPVGLGRVRGGHGRDVGRDEPRRRRRRRDLPDRARPSRARLHDRRGGDREGRHHQGGQGGDGPRAAGPRRSRSSRRGAARSAPTVLLECRDWELDRRLQAVGGQSLTVRGTPRGVRGVVPAAVRRARRAERRARRSWPSRPCSAGRWTTGPCGGRSPASPRPAGSRWSAASRWSSSTARTTRRRRGAWPTRCASSSRWKRLHLVVAMSANKDVTG